MIDTIVPRPRPTPPSRRVDERAPKMRARDVRVFYGDKQALKGVVDRHPRRQRHRLHRPVGLRQVDLPALPQPDERHHSRRRASTGDIELDGEDINSPAMDVVQLRARVGMVFQKPNPFPKSIYENVAYGPRIHGLAARQERAGRDRREIAEARRPVGRGQGPAAGKRHRPVGRPAAAPVHRPRDRGRSRSDPDGRALLGARPDRHRQDRGTDPRAARPLRHRHRHPQHAAGGARVAAHRLLPPRRDGRIWQDQRHLHQPASSSAPRTISPAATADRRATMATTSGHTIKAFDDDLDRLRALISQMGGLAEHAIRESMRCLVQHDLDGAQQDRRGRQEARRARDRDRAPRGPADRAARADGRRPSRRRRGDEDFERGRAHRRLCQEHRQARALLENAGSIRTPLGTRSSVSKSSPSRSSERSSRRISPTPSARPCTCGPRTPSASSRSRPTAPASTSTQAGRPTRTSRSPPRTGNAHRPRRPFSAWWIGH